MKLNEIILIKNLWVALPLYMNWNKLKLKWIDIELHTAIISVFFWHTINLSSTGSRAGIRFATPTLVVITSIFFKKSKKVYFQRKWKDNKVWIRWLSQVNNSQNQTFFAVNYGWFIIGWIYAHTGHTIWKSYKWTIP